MKRVKIERKSSKNPLFEKWILEWKVKAAESGSDNLKFLYGKALRSLQKYPFSLKSGRECVILESFGPKLCNMLDQKLEDYRKSLTEDEWNQMTNHKNPDVLQDPIPIAKKRKPNTKTDCVIETSNDNCAEIDVYVPKYRSGSYAILIALANCNNGSDALNKTHLLEEAKKYCDTSFTKSKPGSFYTAWSSMATLITKNLVSKINRPIRYKLTERGLNLAQKLSVLSKEDIETFSAVTPPSSPLPAAKKITQAITSTGRVSPIFSQEIPSNSSELLYNSSSQTHSNYGSSENVYKKKNIPSSSSVLSKPIKDSQSYQSTSSSSLKTANVLDYGQKNQDLFNVASSSQSSAFTSEESSENCDTMFLFPNKFKIILLVDIHETEMKGSQRCDATFQGLEKNGILCESRHLTVGDFVWIARDSNNTELVLPYIVERKRMDDLASSIKDGRFHEQKFRLRACGLPNIIYLVEKYGSNCQRLGLPLSALQQAAVNSQIVDNFAMKVTENHNDSMLYLSCVTKHLIQLFKDKTLMSCPSPPAETDLNADLVSLLKFKLFNKASVKNKVLTVKEMFLKQLLQLKGLSVDKALAITNQYPTVTDLITALEVNGEKAIADLNYTQLRRIGPAIAVTIHKFYTKNEFT